MYIYICLTQSIHLYYSISEVSLKCTESDEWPVCWSKPVCWLEHKLYIKASWSGVNECFRVNVGEPSSTRTPFVETSYNWTFFMKPLSLFLKAKGKRGWGEVSTLLEVMPPSSRDNPTNHGETVTDPTGSLTEHHSDSFVSCIVLLSGVLNQTMLISSLS